MVNNSKNNLLFIADHHALCNIYLENNNMIEDEIFID